MKRKYKSSYKSHRPSSRFHVTFDDAKQLPDTEVEHIKAEIERDEKFIVDFGENYHWLADEARRRIAYNRERLARIEQTVDGTEPSPYISGGEVMYPPSTFSTSEDVIF